MSRHSRSLMALAALLAVVPVTISPALAAVPNPDLQQLPDEYDLSVLLQSHSGEGTARIDFGAQPDGSRCEVRVDPGQITLLRRGNGGESRLATSDIGLEAAKEHPVKITVKRRLGSIAVLADAHLLMDVEDAGPLDGNGSVTPGGDTTAANVRVQPMEPLYFSDDFMRQPNEAGEWNYDRGQWAIQTIGVVERGANPFSLESRPNPYALASAGYSFWSDYSYEAAAKGGVSNSFGICAGLQDPSNYYLLRWTPGAQGSLELQKVVDGKAEVLAHRDGGFIPNLWYALRLRLTAGRLIAEVDHQPVFNVADTTFGQGKIGLYSAGAGTVWFDSILVRPARYVYDDFSGKSDHHWQAEGDRWLSGESLSGTYTVEAEDNGSGRTVDLISDFKGPDSYNLFSCSPEGAALVTVRGGKREVLARSAEGVPAGKASVLQLTTENGYLAGTIGGRRVAEAFASGRPGGRAGFEPGADAGTILRWAAVRSPDPAEPTDALTAEFTDTQHHPEMKDWAGPLHSWNVSDSGTGTVYWHKGRFYGDTTVRLPLSAADLGSGKFSLILNAADTPASGYEVTCQAEPTDLLLTLSRAGSQVAQAHVARPGDGSDDAVLVAQRRGSFLLAGIGSTVSIHYQDPHPLDGYTLPEPADYGGDAKDQSRIAIQVPHGVQGPSVADVVVQNRHVYAETFHLAPINWRPQSGLWEVTRRWACQPGWTWYGGKSSGYAVNWHKESLQGDQAIDYYSGAMMRAEPGAGEEGWRDLNCSFCADGSNLFSGYTLIIQGWGGQVTRLLRKGHVVAESREFQFPPQGQAHRLWFDTQILRRGGRIRISISYREESGQLHSYPLIDWTDPDPLPGGYVGFWTQNNGMMLARVVLSAQEMGQSPLYTASPVWLARLPQDAPYPNAPDAGITAANLVQPANGELQSPGSQPQDNMVAVAPVNRPTDLNGAPPPDGAVPITAYGLSFSVAPGGTIQNVTYNGHLLVRRIVLDIRTSEWHEVKLDGENTHLNITRGDQPRIDVAFHVLRPDLNMDLSGQESIAVEPGGTVKLFASWHPNSAFDSKRLSLDVVFPAADYANQHFAVQTDAGQKTVDVPDQPLVPIQFATAVKQLRLPATGISVLPTDGIGAFEDLRSFNLAEFWYEQAAPYDYPNIPKGLERSAAMTLRIRPQAVLQQADAQDLP